MSNIIALVWDFDKTLVDGYMQDPIFEKYNVDSRDYWKMINNLPQKYKEEQDVEVNKDTIYLNQFIKDARPNGRFPGLNNEQLKEFGKELKFYKGIPDIFEAVKQVVDQDAYRERDIHVENYVVSTGMSKVIQGSKIEPYMKHIWGCEFIEDENENGQKVISELGYTIDNTSKTRALFEINKGIPETPNIDVNAKVPEELRRVQFKNMIYIADGPSDIPAFSVVKRYGGATFAVYPKHDEKAFDQVEQMRRDERIDMYAEADYSEGTTAYMWLTHKVKLLAEGIVQREKDRLEKSISSAPHHIS